MAAARVTFFSYAEGAAAYRMSDSFRGCSGLRAGMTAGLGGGPAIPPSDSARPLRCRRSGQGAQICAGIVMLLGHDTVAPLSEVIGFTVPFVPTTEVVTLLWLPSCSSPFVTEKALPPLI